MDIEGAEYEVLLNMIKGRSIEYIKNIRVEFHANKFKNENKVKMLKNHEKLKSFFKDYKNLNIGI